jgi:hypothetical protein
MIAPRADHPAGGHFWIPIDDENCWVWNWDYHATRPLSDEELTAMKNGAGRHVIYEAGNTATGKTWRAQANKDNDFLIDRAAQKAGITYSGITGFAMQDSGIQELMGPVVDRTKENLVSTDNGIIMARHRLMRAAKDLAAKGTLPPGRDPSHQKVRSVAVVLPQGTPFKEGAGEALKARAGTAQTSV